jgi:hypothetical protein
MCKKYPGPKCGRHVLEERAKLEMKTEAINAREVSALEEAQNTRNHLNELRRNSGTGVMITRAAKAYDKANSAYEKAKSLRENHESSLEANRWEYGNTPEGIEELEFSLFSNDAILNRPMLKNRLEEAKKIYHSQVLAYDKAFGTVNGKPPAKEYDDEAVAVLQDKIKATDKQIAVLHKASLLTESKDEEITIRVKISKLEDRKKSIRKKIQHCHDTVERIRMGYLPDVLGAEKLRQEAAHAIARAQESYERSDTDGFMSQWASNSVADKNRLKAEIAENNGKSRFRALFDLNGNYVMAKEVNTKFGWAWGVYENPNEPDRFKCFVNESKSKDEAKQAALLLKKGYTMGLIMAPAYVTSCGDTLVSVRNIILQDFNLTRKDTVDVLTVNLYTHPVD